MYPLEKKILPFINKEIKNYFVAFSGGVDSTALLDCASTIIKSFEGQIIDYFSPPLNNKRESATEPRQIEGAFEWNIFLG